ncbi:MAG: class I SAM-dependent methyltransferase [Sulfitobacter sp.]
MPSTTPSRRSIRFWNFIAKKYSRDAVADEASYQRKLAETRALLRDDMQLLEIGAGTGSTAIVHAPHVAHIDAVDVSQKMIDIARSKTTAACIDNITYQCSSVEAFDAPDESYDMVLALSVLHLVQDHKATLAKMHALLKPGGYLVSSTVCLGDAMPAFKWVSKPAHALGLLPYLTYLGKDTLLSDIKAAGFTVQNHWQPGPNKSLFVIARKA